MKQPLIFTSAAIGLLAAVLACRTARAEYTSTDNRIPSPRYMSGDTVVYDNGYRVSSFFDIFVDDWRMAPPPEGSGPQVLSFFDIFTEISLDDGQGSGGTFHGLASGEIRIARLNGLPPGEPVWFDTEMLSMNLAGGNLPPGVMIRESPSRPSMGRTTITDLGGGMYRTASFFDVFTELTNGDPLWVPSDGSMHLEGDLPEPSTLTLAGLGLVACAAMAIRRRRKRGHQILTAN